MTEHFILATAGHVDHGKSSLVKALSGIYPDRLPEEKARGITINLGFSHLNLRPGDDLGSELRLGIVDVPGHEDFVKNMVAGVGAANVALLVVAADDGWMPQTEEHLQILSYLGVTRMVAALTKIDRPGVDAPTASESVRQQLRDTPFATAPIMPVSTVTLEGIDELKAALVSVLSTTPKPRNIGKPRLAVDRAFTLRGVGTVVTGTLMDGSLATGQTIVIQPGGSTARIRTIQSHNENVQSVGPGTRTALNLSDVFVNNSATAGTSHEGVRRGDVVTLPEFGQPASILDVILTRSPRLQPSGPLPVRPLKDGARVRVHHGSGNWPARLHLFDQKEIAAGESSLAQLRFEAPLFAFVDDRFIVRDWSEQTTQAGGVVLGEGASRKTFRDPARRAFLAECAKAVGDARARIVAQMQYAGLLRRADLLLKSGFSTGEIAAAVSGLAAEGKAVVTGELIASPAWWGSLCEHAIGAIEAAHRAHPELVGLPLNELRLALEGRLPFPEAFDALLAALSQKGFMQSGTLIKRATHRPELPPKLQAVGAKLRAALALKPLEPPSRKELAPDAVTQQALRFLIDTGEVVDLGPETVILKDAFARATETIKAFLTAHRSGTVSELKQAVGSSRRIVLPLLERLDRSGVTARQGDQRVLRS